MDRKALYILISLLLLGLNTLGQSAFIKQYSSMPLPGIYVAQIGSKKFVSKPLHGNKIFSTFSNGDSGIVIIAYDGQGNEKLNVALIGANILEPQGIAAYNNTVVIAGRIKKFNGHDAIFVIKTDTLGQVIWYHTFANNNEIVTHNIAVDDNENIVVVGSYNPWEYTGQLYRAFFLLLDKTGNKIAYKAINTNKNYPSLDGVVKISGGGFILSGQTGHAWDYYSALALKISATGTIDWLKIYRMDLPGGNYSLWNAGQRSTLSIFDAAPAGTNRFLLAGYCSDHSQYGNNETFYDGFTLLIDSNGNMIKNTRYKGSGRTSFYSANQNADGTFGITGVTADSKTGYFMTLDANASKASEIGYKISSTGTNFIYGQNKTATGQFLLTGMCVVGSSITPTAVAMDFSNTGCSSSSVSLTEIQLNISSPSLSYTVDGSVTMYSKSLSSKCFCSNSSFVCGNNTSGSDASVAFTAKYIPCTATIMYANYDKSKLICPATFFLVAGTDTSWTDSIVVSKNNTVVTAYQKTGQCTKQLVDTLIKEAYATTSMNLGADKKYCGPMPVLTLDAQVTGSTYQWSTGDTTQTITINTPGIYSVRASIGNCILDDTITITQTIIPKSFGSDETHCAGEKITLRAIINGAGIVNSWSTGETADSIIVSQKGMYTLKTSKNGCTQDDTINIFYLDKFNIDSDTAIHCNVFTPIILGKNLPTGQKYYWSTGDTTRTIIANSAGLYTIRWVAANCETTDSIKIDFIPLTANLGNDTGICISDSVNINLDAQNPGYNYLWSTKDTTQNITATNIGEYWVTVSKGACAITDTIKITTVGKTNLNDIKLCGPRPTMLVSNNPGATYTWSTGETTPYINFPGAGEYWVQVSFDNCVFYDSIKIAEGLDDFYLHIPNAFSPNHDNRNDYFFVQSNGLKLFSLQIFDRWGEVLFTTKDPYFIWNGTYKGEALPGGIYYYTINYLYNCDHARPQIVGSLYIIE